MLQRLRDRYAATGAAQMCTARADVLMALHEAGASVAEAADRAFRMTWVLDACARAGDVTDRHATELADLLQHAQGDALVAMAMACAAPDALHTLSRVAVLRLRSAAVNELLPVADTVLPVLLDLLELGAAAHRIARGRRPGAGGAVSAPTVNAGVLRSLCPVLVLLLLDAEQPVPASAAALVTRCAAGRLLAQALAVDRVAAGDAAAVAQLGALLTGSDGAALTLSEAFLAGLVAAACTHAVPSLSFFLSQCSHYLCLLSCLFVCLQGGLEPQLVALVVLLLPAAATNALAHRHLLRCCCRCIRLSRATSYAYVTQAAAAAPGGPELYRCQSRDEYGYCDGARRLRG